MNVYDFDKAINRLKEVFGHKVYPEERIKVLWKTFERVEARFFEQAVERAISFDRQAPLLNDLSEHVRKAQSDALMLGHAAARQLQACKENHGCGGRGYFLMSFLDGTGTWLASCEQCDLGRDNQTSERIKMIPFSTASRNGYQRK